MKTQQALEVKGYDFLHEWCAPLVGSSLEWYMKSGQKLVAIASAPQAFQLMTPHLLEKLNLQLLATGLETDKEKFFSRCSTYSLVYELRAYMESSALDANRILDYVLRCAYPMQYDIVYGAEKLQKLLNSALDVEKLELNCYTASAEEIITAAEARQASADQAEIKELHKLLAEAINKNAMLTAMLEATRLEYERLRATERS